MAVTLTYVILLRSGPIDSLTNADKSAIQTAVRTWQFTVSCSFHGTHVVSVLDPYTAQGVKDAVATACKSAYQAAPEIGQTWSQTL